MRRITALLLVMLLLLPSVGCNWLISNEPLPSESFVARKELISQYKNGWCYSRLDAQQKVNYAAVFEAVYDSRFTVSTVNFVMDGTQTVRSGVSVTLPYPLTDQQQVTGLYEAFVRDHPQFFFIGNVYGVEGAERFETLQLTYTMDVQTRKMAWDQLEGEVRTLLENLPDGDDFTKELWIHDTLLQRCIYDTQAVGALTSDSFSAYGALVNGKAVCEGYSRAMLLLLNEAGIRATVVTGTDTQGVSHMWNVVNVNGRNYHLDATWNDTDWGVKHTYFNLSTQEIEIDHCEDTTYRWVDTCLAFQDGYYRREGCFINSYELEDIVSATIRRMREGHATIELQFVQEAFNNGKFFMQSVDWFTETINAALAEDEPKLGQYELLSDAVHCELILLLK